MARDYSFRYSVEMTLLRGRMTPSGWPTTNRPGNPRPKALLGKPNDKKLALFMDDYNRSLEPGGVNAHLGPNARAMTAEILDHHNDRKVVAGWNFFIKPREF